MRLQNGLPSPPYTPILPILLEQCTNGILLMDMLGSHHLLQFFLNHISRSFRLGSKIFFFSSDMSNTLDNRYHSRVACSLSVGSCHTPLKCPSFLLVCSRTWRGALRKQGSSLLWTHLLKGVACSDLNDYAVELYGL